MTESAVATVQRLTESTPRPFVVKVGANDGLTGDPFGRLFVDDSRWCGLLIEPVPAIAARLRENFPRDRFAVATVAISNSPGVRPFFIVSDDAPHVLPAVPFWWNQLGSFDRQHIVKHLSGSLEPFVESIDVVTRRLRDVLQQRRVDRVSVLQIDTEGSDLDVLQSLDLDRVRPDVVLVEHSHLSPRDRGLMAELLSRYRYRLSDLGRDWLAVSSELAVMVPDPSGPAAQRPA